MIYHQLTPILLQADIEQVFGIPAEDCIKCSAKSGIGVADILDHIIDRIPAPTPSFDDDKLRALIFDAHYDPYRGVIAYVRVMNGTLTKGDRIKMVSTGGIFDVLDLGYFKPKMTSAPVIKNGNVGYVISNMKQVDEMPI